MKRCSSHRGESGSISRPRAREFGLPFWGLTPGPLNAITDVSGVRVGHTTLIAGEGSQAVRTGVTAILPHGDNIFREKVVGAVHTINGFGKPMGFEQVRELGVIESPICLTNTLNVGLVADALVAWSLQRNLDIGVRTGTMNPLVGECNDGYLNDIRGRHVRAEHVWAALEGAQSGPVAEGNVGAGTGMSAFGFKGGVGTASRVVSDRYGGFTVGVLVVANFGYREQLLIAGVPVGQVLADWSGEEPGDEGSIMIVLATDAPLSARQLLRVARRTAHGLARTGSTATNGSGDFTIAFSTAQRVPHYPRALVRQMHCLAEDGPAINALFQATVEATEEAVLNALFRAETMTGRDGHVRYALPLERVADILREHGLDVA
ncbi:MAG: P1 family peptidase [Anaerolineae bacterium]|nr:P1 family peptidase [Anaerolineae bacterium]